jgi:hypothetical protein
MERSKKLTTLAIGLVVTFLSACATSPDGRPLTDRQPAGGSRAMEQAPSQDMIQFKNYSVGPNANIMVIDPEGRRIGYDREYDAEVNEVPTGSYTGREEAQQVAIRNPIAGSYTFVITGTDAGDFAASISYGAERVVDSRDFRGEIEKGNAFFAIVELDPASREPLQFALFQYHN